MGRVPFLYDVCANKFISVQCIRFHAMPTDNPTTGISFGPAVRNDTSEMCPSNSSYATPTYRVADANTWKAHAQTKTLHRTSYNFGNSHWQDLQVVRRRSQRLT